MSNKILGKIETKLNLERMWPLTSAPPTVMNSQKYLLGATCDMVEIYSSLKLPYLIAMCRNKSRREQYPGSACRQSSSSIISTSDVLTNNSADL